MVDGETGQAFAGISLDAADLSVEEVIVGDLQDAVKKKYYYSHLRGIAPSDLRVYASREAYDAKQKEEPDALIGSGHDEDHPLIVKPLRSKSSDTERTLKSWCTTNNEDDSSKINAKTTVLKYWIQSTACTRQMKTHCRSSACKPPLAWENRSWPLLRISTGLPSQLGSVFSGSTTISAPSLAHFALLCTDMTQFKDMKRIS